MNIVEIKDSLLSFHGTEQFYRNKLTGCLYTDGIKFIAEECKSTLLVTDGFIPK